MLPEFSLGTNHSLNVYRVIRSRLGDHVAKDGD